jgi:hypothetical protein
MVIVAGCGLVMRIVLERREEGGGAAQSLSSVGKRGTSFSLSVPSYVDSIFVRTELNTCINTAYREFHDI